MLQYMSKCGINGTGDNTRKNTRIHKLTFRGLSPSFALILLVSSIESEASEAEEAAAGGCVDAVGDEGFKEGGGGAAFP